MGRAALFAAGFLGAAITFVAWCCLYASSLDDGFDGENEEMY